MKAFILFVVSCGAIISTFGQPATPTVAWTAMAGLAGLIVFTIMIQDDPVNVKARKERAQAKARESSDSISN